ncbi:MAG: hypothetical protein JSU79_02030 [Dehalococcoidales bacterium]|nr:MAG: hypothetical protein JSU79_02030 [Dehalococcoidales bacterium]
MITRLKTNTSSQRGMALIMVLALLALGGLTIAGSLNLSSTIIYDNRISGYAMDCMYSAGAGVEYTIWALENNETIPANLSDNVNGKTITLDIEDKGIFKLYCGDLIYVDDLPPHYDWLTTNGSAVCDGGTCNYTITINYNGDSQQRKITEVGMKLPDGYDYVDNSSSLFPDNITFDDPDESGEGSAGKWIRWLWNPGNGPVISDVIPSVNQTFMIAGAGGFDDDDHYTWMQIQSVDIGVVGEITGERHTITSTAIGPETVDSVVEADVIIVGGSVYVMSWQILD